jgi:hypothetical protein
MRAILADAVVSPRLKIVESIPWAAVDEGDIDPTLTPLTSRIGPALMLAGVRGRPQRAV